MKISDTLKLLIPDGSAALIPVFKLVVAMCKNLRLIGEIQDHEEEGGMASVGRGTSPQSVREMAGKTGLPVYTVSLKLNDLERRGQAELKCYEGSTPKFIGLG